MKIFLATNLDKRTEFLLKNTKVKNDILISYYYIKSKQSDRFSIIKDLCSKINKKIVIDSGVFTARQKDEILPLDKYIDFCKANIDSCSYFFTLDQGTYEEQLDNFKALTSEGIPTIGIVSDKMSLQQIQAFIDIYPYIAISWTANFKTSDDVRYKNYLNGFFRYLLDTKQIDKVKVHALGVTKDDMFNKYPFFSSDSSSWVSSERFGQVFEFKNGRLKRIATHVDKEAVVRRLPVKLLKQVSLQGNFEGYTAIYSAEQFSLMEKYYTDLWTKRGIVWENGKK